MSKESKVPCDDSNNFNIFNWMHVEGESKVPCDDLIIVIPVNLIILSLNQMK